MFRTAKLLRWIGRLTEVWMKDDQNHQAAMEADVYMITHC